MAGPIDGDIVASARPKLDLASAVATIQLSGLTVSYQPKLCGAGAKPEVAAACEAALASFANAHGLVADQGERRIDFDCNELFVGVCALDSYTMMQRHSIEPGCRLWRFPLRVRSRPRSKASNSRVRRPRHRSLGWLISSAFPRYPCRSE